MYELPCISFIATSCKFEYSKKNCSNSLEMFFFVSSQTDVVSGFYGIKTKHNIIKLGRFLLLLFFVAGAVRFV